MTPQQPKGPTGKRNKNTEGTRQSDRQKGIPGPSLKDIGTSSATKIVQPRSDTPLPDRDISLRPNSAKRAEPESSPTTDITMETGVIPSPFAQLGKVKIYPNIADDPDPIDDDASFEERKEYAEKLKDYADDILAALRNTAIQGESLWLDFITSFRPHTIKTWEKPYCITWTEFLTDRGVFVEKGRKQSRTQSIIDILYRDKHIPCEGTADFSMNKPTKKGSDTRSTNPLKQKQGHYVHPDRVHLFNQNSKSEEKYDVRSTTDTDTTPTHAPWHQRRDHTERENLKPGMAILEGSPPGDDDESSDTSDEQLSDERSGKGLPKDGIPKEEGNPREPSDKSDPPWEPPKGEREYARGDPPREPPIGTGEEGPEPPYHRYPGPTYGEGLRGGARPLGITGLMRAFVGKPTFSGNWDEDLDNCLNIFNTLALMCEVTEPEKLKAIPIMLTGDALNYFSNNSRACNSFDDAMKTLREWYNSDDKKSRILSKWQSMTLSKAMSNAPEESEVTVFRQFVSKLMSLQHQLDPTYHSDNFLRDRLLTAVDIPAIQATLRDRMPRTSQQAVNRVANQLCDQSRSAGSNSACFIDEKSSANYTLGRSYGGDAKRETKKPWHNNKNPGGGKRRLCPAWMRGVKGCFVCGEDHNANTRHSKDEVTKAVNKLKAEHPKALLTIEDLAAVMLMTTENDDDDDESGVRWADDDNSDEESDIAFMTTESAISLESALSNTAFVHGRTFDQDMASALVTMNKQLRGGDATKFDGITIDTGANRKSVMSRSQYLAYQQEFGRIIPIRKYEKDLKGIGGISKVLGIARIQIPFLQLGVILDIDFAIVDQDCPSLLCNKDLIENGLDISLQKQNISIGNKRQDLSLENFFLIYRWSASSTPFVLYTTNDLMRIHRNFGHPSVKATHHLLKRANDNTLDPKVKEAVTKIASDCKVCLRNSTTPRRFKLTTGTDDFRFNHRVIVDTMYIDGRAVIHIIDECTHFVAAEFLKSQSTEEIWKAITRLWLLTYMGPPDFLAVDQGSGYVSKEMKENVSAQGIILEEAPIETPGAIGVVERYHAPLRSAYTKIRQTLSKGDTNDHECLKMAVYANNSTMGPEGLCPMLLVFGALPRPARTSPSPTQLVRQQAIEDAKIAVEREQAKRRLSFALKHSGGPIGKEISEKLRNLPSGSPVLVYRTVTKRWEGPFIFISVNGETAVIQLPRGRKIFRTSCIKPWTESLFGKGTLKTDENSRDDVMMTNEEGSTLVENKRDSHDDIDLGHEPRKIKVKKGSLEEAAFQSSRKAELEGLIQDGTFVMIHESDVDSSARIFGSRFVDELKRVGDELKKKSRLIAQNYADDEATSIATKAPTVQRFSQRVALSIAASLPATDTYTRDITQAYVQSKSNLERDVFIRAPPELGLEKGFVLKVVKPLYGIPESGLHWYLTYLTHHLETLEMKRARADPCVLIKRNDKELEGLILLQVDDSLGVATKPFLAREEKASKTFRCKQRTMITDKPTSFNGIMIHKEGTKMVIAQKEKIDRLHMVDTQVEFNSQRALAQYVGVNVRPDVCAPIQLIAPGSQPTTDAEFKSLRRSTKFLKETRTQGLNFTPLNLETVRLVLLSDASFGNAAGLKSQLGYLIMMVDSDDNCNIVHYGSNRCKRVARSVMAAEIQALVLGFDYAFVVKDLIEEILGHHISLDALIDSRTVFNVIAKDAQTAERRLQIDVLALRQSYDAGELERIGWIPGDKNPADSLTKPVLNIRSPLFSIMVTNRFLTKPQGWSVSNEEK